MIIQISILNDLDYKKCNLKLPGIINLISINSAD